MKKYLIISLLLTIGSISAFAEVHEEPVTHHEILKAKNRYGHPTAPRQRDFDKYKTNQEEGSHPRGRDILRRPQSPSGSGQSSPR